MKKLIDIINPFFAPDELGGETQELEITPVEEENADDESKDESTPEEISRAQRMGWIPKETFKGDVAKWRPAKDFLARGEQELPILRERYKKVDSALEKTQTELAEIKRNMNEFVTFTRSAAQREADKRIEKLNAVKDEAFDAGDKEAFNAADKEIQKLETEKPTAQPTNQLAPAEIQSWFDANPWYQADKELQSYADSMGDHFKRTKGLIGPPLLEEVRKAVESAYPAKFENPARNHAAAVGAAGGNGTGAAGGKKGRSFNDLPNEAKLTCNNWVRNGLGTKEEYLKFYDWS